MVRKKSNLSRHSRTSRNNSGTVETLEARNRRLSLKRDAAKRRIRNETTEERSSRLSNLSTNSQRYIEQETEEETLARLFIVNSDSRRRIDNETEEERLARLSNVNEDTRRRIENETEEERLARLLNVNGDTQRRIEDETEEERLARLLNVTEDTRRRIEDETEEEKLARLLNVNEHTRRRIDNETEEERLARLLNVTEDTRRRIEDETEEKRLARLLNVNEHTRRRIYNETEEERLARLLNVTEDTRRRIEDETEEERLARLLNVNEHTRRIIDNETEEERLARLSNVNEDTRRRIDNETEEERLARLLIINEDTRRRNETEEERLARLLIVNENTRRRIDNESVEIRIERLISLNVNNKRTLERETEENRNKRLRLARDYQTQSTSNTVSVEDRRYNIWRKNVSGCQWKKAAYNYNKDIDYKSDNRITIGSMNIVCTYCKAYRFKGETKGLCCNQGKVKVEVIKEPPFPLNELLFGRSTNSKHFFMNIRNFNSAFQMTSFGASKIIRENFMPTFKIQGQVYHNIGSVYPEISGEEKYLQIYFMGNNEDEINKRSDFFPTLTKSILKEIQDMLHINNEKIKNIKYALERNYEPNFKLVIKEDRRPPNEHERRFNRPTNNEVAIVMIGDTTNKRDIIIHNRDSTVHRINEIHPAYDCLQYPLIYCKGEDTWDINMKQKNETKLPCMRYYAYIIMMRENE